MPNYRTTTVDLYKELTCGRNVFISAKASLRQAEKEAYEHQKRLQRDIQMSRTPQR